MRLRCVFEIIREPDDELGPSKEAVELEEFTTEKHLTEDVGIMLSRILRRLDLARPLTSIAHLVAEQSTPTFCGAEAAMLAAGVDVLKYWQAFDEKMASTNGHGPDAKGGE